MTIKSLKFFMPKKSWKILGNVSNKFYQNLEHSYTILISSTSVIKKIDAAEKFH